jgi:glutamine synthetase
MLAAGLEGMEKGYPLRDPVERNVYEMGEEERKRYKIDSLPEDLYEAIKITEKSDLIKRALGDHVFQQFIENKMIEWERYRARVTDYELEQYFSIL